MIVGVAILLDNIEVVFNAAGAICAASIAILLPCFFYFRLIVIRKQPKNIKYYLSILIFVVMIPYSLFSIVALYINTGD